jgi:hypothetical protein
MHVFLVNVYKFQLDNFHLPDLSICDLIDAFQFNCFQYYILPNVIYEMTVDFRSENILILL